MDKTDLVIQIIKDLKEDVNVRLDKLNSNQLLMNKDLDKHMKRSDSLEALHDLNKKEIDEAKEERNKNSLDIEELKKPVEARKYILKTIKALAAIGTLALIGLRLAGKI